MKQPATPVATGLGRFIKMRREALGMSQNDLASRLRTKTGKPVAVSQVSRWERLNHAGWLPKPDVLSQLARALQVEPSVLVAAARPESQPDLGDTLEMLSSWQVALSHRRDLHPEVAGLVEDVLARARRLQGALDDRDDGQRRVGPSTL